MFPQKKTLCYICTLYRWQNVGKTMPFLPPMTGNGNHTTYNNGDDWGWFITLFYPESQLMMYPLVN